MTDHIHTCTPGCTECDRARDIALAIELDVYFGVATPAECIKEVAAEIRALHAQREALTQEVARLREELKLRNGVIQAYELHERIRKEQKAMYANFMEGERNP